MTEAESAICFKTKLQLQNPAYNVVFNAKVGRSFQNKPNQIPSLGICDLHEVGFRKKKLHEIVTNCCVSALSESC